MYNFLTSLAAVAVVLGVMITVHEFGHFAAAKLFRVRVEQFAIGFGKRLIGFRKGETDYRLNLLPLGGYVKMSGENPMETHTGDPGEFSAHPRWQRFIIAFAGPFMNLVLAFGLLVGVYMVHYEYPVYATQPAVIGWVTPNSPADKAGIERGDRIVRIADIQNPTWEQVLPEVVLSPGHPVNLAIQRGDKVLEKTIVPTPTGVDQLGSPGWEPSERVAVRQLEPDMPAATAGIKEGDLLVAVNGQPINSVFELLDVLKKAGANTSQIMVLRDHQKLTVPVTPKLTDDPTGGKRYRIGVMPDSESVNKQLSFPKAVAESYDQNKRNSLLIMDLVEKMVRRQVSMKQIEGPVRIAQISGEAAREEGWTPLLSLMAAISLNLAIFNLFPFPILDGGVILLLLIEAIRRRDISLPVKEKIYQLAFVLLILFAVVVIYNDLMKTIPGAMQHLP